MKAGEAVGVREREWDKTPPAVARRDDQPRVARELLRFRGARFAVASRGLQLEVQNVRWWWWLSKLSSFDSRIERRTKVSNS